VNCMGKKEIESFSEEETKCRFEAALRGAREVGHEPMKDISPKRSKPHSEMKVGKTTVKKKTSPENARKKPNG
jgi:hypothetical protein